NHLPPYLAKHAEFKAKGVAVIAVVAANDLCVMSGWARFDGCKDKVRLQHGLLAGCRSWPLSDTYAKWSESLWLSVNLTERGLGLRTARYAMIIDDLVVKYIEVRQRSRLISACDLC
ncbi:hypothetical protein B0H15DRAFT_999707, partial [Mycena belliarum]